MICGELNHLGIMCQEDTSFAMTMTKDVLVRVVFSNDVAMSIEKDKDGAINRLIIMIGNTRQSIDLLDHGKSENEIISFVELQYIGLKRSFSSLTFEGKFNMLSDFSWEIKKFTEN